MVHIYLCDDNSKILQQYQMLLTKIAEKNQILIHIMTFFSGEQLIFHLSESPNDADIIYLDILMEELNGINTAKKLRSLGCHSEIIFLTSSEEYIFDSFDISPTNYILKSEVSYQRFEAIFLRAVELAKQKEAEVFACESGTITQKIPIKSIAYFEVRNRIISVYYKQNSFDFYSSMEKLESLLKGKDFIRVHRSYMVHLPYIDQIQKDALILITGHKIPLGITYGKNVKLAVSRQFMQPASSD